MSRETLVVSSVSHDFNANNMSYGLLPIPFEIRTLLFYSRDLDSFPNYTEGVNLSTAYLPNVTIYRSTVRDE